MKLSRGHTASSRKGFITDTFTSVCMNFVTVKNMKERHFLIKFFEKVADCTAKNRDYMVSWYTSTVWHMGAVKL